MLEQNKKGFIFVAVIYNNIYFSILTLRAVVCSLISVLVCLTGSSGLPHHLLFGVGCLGPAGRSGARGSLGGFVSWFSGFLLGSRAGVLSLLPCWAQYSRSQVISRIGPNSFVRALGWDNQHKAV